MSGLVISSALMVGCKQQVFMPREDFEHYHALGLSHLETNMGSPITPETCCAGDPTTVLDPERKPRCISLAECIAIALESGTVGNTNILISPPGLASENLIQPVSQMSQFGGLSVVGDDSIRVLSFEPSLAASEIEQSLAKFDTQWVSSMTWNKTDRPVGTALDQLQAQGGQTSINTDEATFNTSLVKPLPTGGLAGITFSTDYQLTNLTSRVNPSYRPTLQFGFEQPLLQGFGVEINQLRTIHPLGLGNNDLNLAFYNNTEGQQRDGILITRLHFDQARAAFEANVNYMLVNVEGAYWNLYGAYWALYSREQGLRQAYEAWKINKARFEAGRIPIQDFAQSRQQYETFRSQRISALGSVLENERRLRSLMGLPIEDGTRLVPCDAPTLAPYHPDWCTSLNEALALRPELIMCRQDLKFQQLRLIEEKNRLLPDLRFFSTYDITGLGSSLTGSAPNNALQNFASNHFNDWEVGIRLAVPLGYRDANALVHQARMRLAQSHFQLQDQELKVQRALAFEYRQLFEFHEQIQAQRALRLAAATQLEARFKEFLAGRGTLDFLLEAQRVWADALSSEYNFIVQYNIALSAFEFTKGTILQYDNVYIAEGPVPQLAQRRAVEHLKQRTDGLVVLQRERPVLHPATVADAANPNPGLPVLPENNAPALPAVLDQGPKAPEKLPTGPDLVPFGRATTTMPGTPLPTPRELPPTPSPAPVPQPTTGLDDPTRDEPRRLPATTNGPVVQ